VAHGRAARCMRASVARRRRHARSARGAARTLARCARSALAASPPRRGRTQRASAPASLS
jgi:phytoene/squalene synthetase